MSDGSIWWGGARPDPARMTATGAHVMPGLLGIEFHTRRRNRANGVIEVGAPGVMRVRVNQSFGNCPQYIATRELGFLAAPPELDEPIARLAGSERDLAKRRVHVRLLLAAERGVGHLGFVARDHRSGLLDGPRAREQLGDLKVWPIHHWHRAEWDARNRAIEPCHAFR